VMPYIDGFEVARRLRRDPRFQDVVIIAASASVFNLTPQESLAAGCNAFITKPVRAQKLLELLQQHLGLTWIYEQPLPLLDSHPATETPNQADNVELLKVPSAEQATILYEFCMLGDIDGLLVEVEKMEQADAQLVHFANQIRRLAKNFELDKIDGLVGRYV
jgi:response regulator RpfG family c-di-GMP phosphodiesterase